MLKKSIIILILLLFPLYIYADGERNSSLIGVDGSYLEAAVGTFSGLTLVTDNMQLSGGYSFWLSEGFYISTDLFLYNPSLKETTISTGVGGGIIFNPELNDFSSFAYLRLPFKVIYESFYFSAVPMLGLSMFEYETEWDINLSLMAGIRFNIKQTDAESNQSNRENQR